MGGTTEPKNSNGNDDEKKKCAFVQRWKFNGNKEAQAWALMSIFHGIAIAATGISTIPLLRIAEHAAGCGDLPEGEECENEVYGFRPSSLLPLIQTISGALMALIIPFIGGMVDRTKHRRPLTIISASVVLAYSVTAISMNENNWFIISLISVISFIAYFLLNLLMNAYLAELTEDNDELTEYNAQFLMLRGAIIFPYAFVVLLITYLFTKFEDTNSVEFDIVLFRTCCAVEASFFFLLMIGAFRLGFPNREAKQTSESSPFEAVFQLHKTLLMIYREYNGLFYFMVALIPFANSVASIGNIGVTYITLYLQASNAEITLSAVLLSLFGVIGSRIQPIICRKLGHLKEMKLNMILWMLILFSIAAFVRKQEHLKRFFVIAAVFGIVWGWSLPSMRTIYIILMPKGREAEIMGIYMFCTAGFLWAPPLLFTILNESGLQMNVTMGIFAIPYALALLAVQKIKEEDLTKNDETDNMSTDSPLLDKDDSDSDNDVEKGKEIKDVNKDVDIDIIKKEATPTK
eukprot:CAMPEP_0178943398 /NCGR_PEP_ID=MMETSP0789-20121207/2565_1 /TAXON_ID=3005 /ORGANISM="Rhizosolenia setigera, Strain CCMP 1694" /LENGTH=517 /DNA_ID=CAMNT_0020622989 /DNA_START=208 /DNA_END=1761 /DNA_ORIENTATION=+